MKTKMITAALAGCIALPAWAQSNVTIFGIADLVFGYGKAGDQTFTGALGDGGLAGNRIGFKGSEDLGNGLKAVFLLEQGFGLGTGNFHRPGRTFSRQSWAGLQGGFGTVSLGYQYAPGYAIPGAFQVMGGSAAFAPRSMLSFAGGYTIAPGSGARWDNAVRYAPPAMGGLEAQFIYAFHASQSDDGNDPRRGDDDRWGVGLTYSAGPVKAGLAYHNVGPGSAADDTKELFVGGSYDLGVVKIVASWSKKDADGSTAADNTLVSAGLVAPVGASGSVHLGFARLNPEGDDNNGKAATFGYIHNLSKRTNVYAAFNRVEYDANAPVAVAATVAAADEGANSILAGMFHRF